MAVSPEALPLRPPRPDVLLLELVEVSYLNHRKLRRYADDILMRYAADNSFEDLAARLAADGIEIDEFIEDSGRFGVSVHVAPNGVDGPKHKVEMGLYPDEEDRLEWIGSAYFDEQGVWRGFNSRADDNAIPPQEVVDALEYVAARISAR